MSELKPCPFCGSEAIIYTYDEVMDADLNTSPRYQPECLSLDCIATETGIAYLTESEAIEAWNTRVPNETVSGEVELFEYDNIRFIDRESCSEKPNSSSGMSEIPTFHGKELWARLEDGTEYEVHQYQSGSVIWIVIDDSLVVVHNFTLFLK